ncbi:Inherit from bactNOG: secreted protein [Seminavis robusta]|uniref:Inherit from bactNOG: secreted protein n=1 Tax=Seminavis robusta TaxID=568900 RepID=A0A9N8F2D0_9STRA|nr:Inherit from bactNOG: secreted protein [Seminavis robusta]|eukprot:Sro3475_g348440.1 Inherit from bactNOG: secreted protein (216) ;mRNA; f:5607-6343
MKTVLSFLVVALLSLPGSLARVGTSHVADEDDHHPRGLERALDDAINYLNPSTIDYNREGKKINPSKGGDLFDGYPDFPHSSIGFLWQDDDDATIKWRPQGISGFEYDGKEYLLVSWYGKKKKRRFDYRNRGFRVSFVDITDMDRIKYRHILFVDEDGETYEDCHAGGLAFKDGVLHIPDSRGSNDQILTFPIDAIEEVDADSYYNYRLLSSEHR